MLNYSTSEENYIKTIFHLQEGESTVTTNELARELQTRPASVTDMMKKLKAKKLLHYKPYQGFRLNTEGNKVALGIIRRHRLWEYFLAEKLKFTWDEVHEVAEDLEHVSNKKLIDKLDEFLGFPRFDPHGDPIPDTHGKIKVSPQVSLAEAMLNKTVIVAHVADQSTEMLDLLKHKNIHIGTRLEIKKKFDFDNSVEIRIRPLQPFTISEKLASNLFVSYARNSQHYRSLSEVHESIDTTVTNRPVWRRILSFFGPAYLVSVGYMDPGNWATDLAGGSQFGYKLLWVLLMSNLMALLLQSLSARLGVVRGRDLAQANREVYPRYINLPLYVLAEVAIAACDLAEVLGMAIGLQLLTGIPLLWGVLITVLDTFLLLFLQRLGMRKMEVFIIGLVFIIGMSFLIEIILAKPQLGEVITGFAPHIPNKAALYIAIGIIGATVMPHNLYLHSALVQTRKIKRDKEGIRKALRLNFWDSTIALNLAFFVNAAILILAATVFFKAGRTDVAEIKDAHHLLDQFLGTKLAPTLFAIALIASGQSSTVTGTLAGQIIMEGYLHLRINPWMRRLLTRLVAIIPAVIVILINGENNIDSLLVLSQVILSLQLGFAIIPLIHFVSDKKTMGSFAIKPLTKAAAWIVTSILVYLNIRMVTGQAMDYFQVPGHLFWKIVIVVAGLAFIGLLIIATVYPLLKRKLHPEAVPLHQGVTDLHALAVPAYKKIAIALEFSEKDEKLLSHAIGQAHKDCSFVLIHVVESVPAKLLETDSDDLETRTDQQQIDFYADRLKLLGYEAKGILGFNRRSKEIVRIIRETGADMLVMGAHGHSGIKDWFYGQTIDTVRHELNIPVLVVNV